MRVADLVALWVVPVDVRDGRVRKIEGLACLGINVSRINTKPLLTVVGSVNFL